MRAATLRIRLDSGIDLKPGAPAEKAAAILAVLLLQCVFPAFAQPRQIPQASPLPARVEIRVQAAPEKATVGDPIQIDLDISLPKGWQAETPKLESRLGDFEILRYYPGPDVPGGELSPARSGPSSSGETAGHYKARVVAALYRTGAFEFPALEISLRAPDGKTSKVFSNPVKIQIVSVLAGTDPQLKALKKQAEIQAPVDWLFWTAIGLLLAICAGLAWMLYLKRRRPASSVLAQPQPDPLVMAEADLRALIGRGLLDRGFVKQFYVALSEILKRILQAGMGVHTIEKTTSEIMDELRHRQAMAGAADYLDLIEAVLIGCDLVKFAKYVPSRVENDESIKNALRILEAAKRQKSAPPALDQPAAAGVS
jgi:hypothetical protein